MKRISTTDFNYIWEPSEQHRKADWARTVTMTKDHNGFHFKENVKTWLFVLLYVPELLMNFFYCLWDGGLREFSLPCRNPQDWHLWESDRKYIEEHFKRAEEIWEKV